MPYYYEVKKNFPFYVALKTLGVFWRYRLNRTHLGLGVTLWNATLHLFIIVFEMILPLVDLIVVARVYEELDMSEHISDMIACSGFILLYSKMLQQYRCVNAICLKLVDHTKFGKPKTFDEVTKYCRFISLFFLVFTTAGLCAYGSTFLFNDNDKTGPCDSIQEQTDWNLYCNTFIPFWLPINVNRTLLFFVQFVVDMSVYTPGTQTIAMCCCRYREVRKAVAITGTLEESRARLPIIILFLAQGYLLICESVYLLTSHVDFLLDHIRAAIYEKDSRTRSSMLRFCVKYHIHTLEMAEEISSLHKTVTGHMKIIWACIFGSVCNQILNNVSAMTILGFSGMFMICYFFVDAGQTLLNKSEDVSNILYEYPWYMGSIDDQKIIMFMIKRAQIPMTLTAAPFGNYGYSFLVMVMKTAYSYLTLLRQKT